MTFDATTQEDLQKIKVAILKELREVEAIYLFGSVAKGSQTQRSDYDIVVFVKKLPEDKRHSILSIINGVSDHISRPLELFILDLDDLKFPSPFLYEVYHNHRLIYGNNIITKCKDAIKNIRPIVRNGVQVGYHV